MYVEVNILGTCDLVIGVKFSFVVLTEEWKQWQGPVLLQHISCVLWVVRKPQPSDATFGKKPKESKREAWKVSNEEAAASFEKGKLLSELQMDTVSEL